MVTSILAMNFKDPLVLAEDKTSEKKAHKLATELGLFFEGNLKNLREKKNLEKKTLRFFLSVSSWVLFLFQVSVG